MDDAAEGEVIDGSALCLACGLCCNGSLFSVVPLGEDELPLATRMRLAVVDDGGRRGFSTPCRHLDGACCTQYHVERPRRCGEFRCELLERYLAREMPLASCVERVEKVKSAIASYEASATDGTAHEIRAQARFYVHIIGVRALVHEPT